MMIAVNYNMGFNVGNIANEKTALIQPANYAFSIWGLIYLLLFIWIMRGFFVKDEKVSVYEDLRLLIPVNFLLNSAWIIAFTQQKFLLSTVIIILLLLSLFIIYKTIKQNPDKGSFDLIPFSIYLGWVSVATIVNIFTYFVRTDMTTFLGIDELGWTIIALIFGCMLAVSFSLFNEDILYPLVFIWSYVAIFSKSQEDIIKLVLIMCVIVMFGTILHVLITKKERTITFVVED